MTALLEWARGPAFVFAITFMILGMLRHVGVTIWEMRRTLRRAGDKSLPAAQLWMATLKWLFPLGKIRNQFVGSLTSIIFHVAIMIVPLFLAGHIALWSRGIGLSWPAIPNALLVYETPPDHRLNAENVEKVLGNPHGGQPFGHTVAYKVVAELLEERVITGERLEGLVHRAEVAQVRGA